MAFRAAWEIREHDRRMGYPRRKPGCRDWLVVAAILAIPPTIVLIVVLLV